MTSAFIPIGSTASSTTMPRINQGRMIAMIVVLVVIDIFDQLRFGKHHDEDFELWSLSNHSWEFLAFCESFRESYCHLFRFHMTSHNTFNQWLWKYGQDGLISIIQLQEYTTPPLLRHKNLDFQMVDSGFKQGGFSTEVKSVQLEAGARRTLES